MNQTRGAGRSRAIILGLALVALWLLLSGIYKPLLIGFGIGSAVFVVALCARMELIDREAVPLQLSLGIFGYLAWLTREIAKANVAVARIILSPSPSLQSRFIAVACSQKTDLGRVIFANSITLTPGTVTIEIEPGRFIVHALADQFADAAALADMDARVSAIEER